MQMTLIAYILNLQMIQYIYISDVLHKYIINSEKLET